MEAYEEIKQRWKGGSNDCAFRIVYQQRIH